MHLPKPPAQVRGSFLWLHFLSLNSFTSSPQWISHRNHRGNLCGVDFIWLLNPSSQLAPLTADWKAAIFGMIKAKLHKKGLEERDAFNFFQAGGEGKDKDVVTLQDFHTAMDQVRGLFVGFLWLLSATPK
jgi:hypothetical protein